MILEATTRTILGKKVKRSRDKGLLPAVVYGHGVDSKPVFVDAKQFKKVYHEAGTSALVDLKIDGEKAIKILFHEPQVHYLKGTPIHADFQAIKMSEKLETAIPLHFIGQSEAVEELEGNLVTNKDELEIRCLPGDLISEIEVDISVLKTFDDKVLVSDIKLPDTIEVLDDLEAVVVFVQEPRSEEELEAELAEDVDAEKAAVEELGKEESAEEGAAADESTE
jgi:large subunit ribosomal protein L25